MFNKVVGRKFELFPVKLEENRVHCETCGGTKWMIEDEKWLVQCKDCYDGTWKVCPICGKVIPKTHYECFDCSPIKEARAELARLEKAEKIEPDSERARSFGMMYSEAIGGDEDAYFSDWGEFFEKWHDPDSGGERKRPDYVWGTTMRTLSLDAYTVLENALDDFYEGASDYIGDKGYATLQTALDEWIAKYGNVTSYDFDYRVAIRIPWEDDDYDLAQEYDSLADLAINWE